MRMMVLILPNLKPTELLAEFEKDMIFSAFDIQTRYEKSHALKELLRRRKDPLKFFSSYLEHSYLFVNPDVNLGFSMYFREIRNLYYQELPQPDMKESALIWFGRWLSSQ